MSPKIHTSNSFLNIFSSSFKCTPKRKYDVNKRAAMMSRANRLRKNNIFFIFNRNVITKNIQNRKIVVRMTNKLYSKSTKYSVSLKSLKY